MFSLYHSIGWGASYLAANGQPAHSNGSIRAGKRKAVAGTHWPGAPGLAFETWETTSVRINPHVIHLHVSRKDRRRIRAARPVASDGEVQDDELWSLIKRPRARKVRGRECCVRVRRIV